MDIKEKNNPVIIIGGGTAGLAAAKKLKENNIPVLVLEGRNRIGGRVHTINVTDEGSSALELGAKWITGASGNAEYELALEEGLEMYSEESSMGIFNNIDDSGHWMSLFQSVSLFGSVGLSFLPLNKCYPEGTSVYDALLFLDESSIVFKTIEAFLSGLMALPIDELSANYFCKGYYYDQESYSVLSINRVITGGKIKFIEVLSQSLTENEVVLNKNVTSITVSPEDGNDTSKVFVQTSDGSIYEGRNVIVTVPIGVLKANTIVFNPPLPEEKQAVIERIGNGMVERIAMTFKNAFWRECSDEPRAFQYVSKESPPRFPAFLDDSDQAGIPTLFALVSGPVAQELLNDPDSLISEMKDVLQLIFPDLYEPPISVFTSKWLGDPFSRGSYAGPSISTLPGDFVKLAEPIHNGSILFAGDSTHQLSGYVEGAMLSGEREAERIISNASVKRND